MAQVFRRDREATVEELRQVQGIDLRPLAQQYGVYFQYEPLQVVNPSWILNTLELLLELPRDSLKNIVFEDDYGPWRIELASLEEFPDGWTMRKHLTTVRILEVDPLPPFLMSHLYNWITRQLLVGISSFRLFQFEEMAGRTIRVGYFDTRDPKYKWLLEEIEADYELVRSIIGQENGYSMLTRYMCKWLDPPLTRKHDFGVREYCIHGPQS